MCYSFVASFIRLRYPETPVTGKEMETQKGQGTSPCGARLPPICTWLQSPGSAPLCLGVSAGGRRLNGRWQSLFPFSVHPFSDKMRQILVCGVAVCEDRIHKLRTCVAHCRLGVNPSIPHHNHSYTGPVKNMILY